MVVVTAGCDLLARSVVTSYIVKSNRAADYATWNATVEAQAKELAAGEAPVKELVTRLVPQAQEMASYRTFGQQKGHVQAIQMGIVSAIQSVAQDDEIALKAPSRKPVNGGDPVTQSVFLDSIKIPELQLNEDNIFRPTTSGRIVEIVVLIHKQASNEKIFKMVADKLTGLTVGKAMQHVNKIDASVKLFKTVNSDSEDQKTIRWRYRQDNFVDDDGVITSKLDQNQTRYTAMTFICELADF